MSEFPTCSEDSASTSDPPTPPPRRQKPSTSTGKHKGARTHKVKEGEGKGKWKKRRDPSPFSASSRSDSISPDLHHKSTKEFFKKQKVKSSHKTEPSSQDGSSHSAIFQKHYSNLVMSISQCLNTVANLLFSGNLISSELLGQVLAGRETDQKLASKVVFGVQDYIRLNPDYLIKFIDILKKESSCEEISKKIMSK